MPSKVRHSFNVPGRMELGRKRDVNHIKMSDDNEAIELTVKGESVALFSSPAEDAPSGMCINSLLLPDIDSANKIALSDTSWLPVDFDPEITAQQGLIIDMNSFTSNYRLFIPHDANNDTVFFHPVVDQTEATIKSNSWIFKKEISTDFSDQVFVKYCFGDTVYGQGPISSLAAQIGGQVSVAHCTNGSTIVPVTTYSDTMLGINCTPENCLTLIDTIDVIEYSLTIDGQAELKDGDDTETGSFFGFDADDFAVTVPLDKYTYVANKCLTSYQDSSLTSRQALCYDKLIPVLWNGIKQLSATSLFTPVPDFQFYDTANDPSDQVCRLQTRHITDAEPQVVFEPLEADIGCALAVAPSSNSAPWGGSLGRARIQVVDNALIESTGSTQYTALQLANRETSVEVGSRQFGGTSVKELHFTMNTLTRAILDTNGAFHVGTATVPDTGFYFGRNFFVRSQVGAVILNSTGNAANQKIYELQLGVGGKVTHILHNDKVVDPESDDRFEYMVSQKNGGLVNTVVASPTANVSPTQEFSAVLSCESPVQGFLPPRVASNASIASPVEGLIIYSLDSDKLEVYNGTAWEIIASAV